MAQRRRGSRSYVECMLANGGFEVQSNCRVHKIVRQDCYISVVEATVSRVRSIMWWLPPMPIRRWHCWIGQTRMKRDCSAPFPINRTELCCIVIRAGCPIGGTFGQVGITSSSLAAQM